MLGREARWAWLAALVASLAFPLLAERGVPEAAVVDLGLVPVVARVVTSPVPQPSPALAALDAPLLVGWAAASCTLLLLLLMTQRRLRQVAASGTMQELDGHRVCLTPASGPAVVGGFQRATIVLPAWITDLEPHARELAVRHEAEHLHAGDVRLLAGAVLAVVACPWNPFIWWLVRRLRDAVELDCDLRLLRAGVDVPAYGALLLEVARRAPRHRLAIALAARPSLLSRRLDHMTPVPSSTRGIRALAVSALATLMVIIACEAPIPAADLDRSPAAPSVSLADQPPRLVSAPAPLYPPLLREAGIEGDVVLEFLVDATGRVDSGSIVVIPGAEKVHVAFERPAADVIRAARYQPAVINGTPTALRIRQTVSFRIPRPAPAVIDERVVH
jgi:TonB family protein